jgi:hypothetical protein
LSDDYARLNKVLSALERGILEAKDSDLLSGKKAMEVDKTVRSLIETRLAIHEEKLATPIPSNAQDRRLLLDLLARNTPSMPREVRMAYGTGKKLSNFEVSVLLRKLVLQGMLSSAKKK